MDNDTLEALQIANGLVPSPATPELTPRLLGRYEGVAAAVEALAAAGFPEASAWLKSRERGQSDLKELLRLLDEALEKTRSR